MKAKVQLQEQSLAVSLEVLGAKTNCRKVAVTVGSVFWDTSYRSLKVN
jgi:hypothetical protein